MARFTPADPETNTLVHQVREKHFPGLAPASVACVMAEADRPMAAASVRVSSPAQRSAGLADALLIVDAARFADASASGKQALIAHGLAGVLVITRGQHAALDAAGRPRLRKIPHDLPGLGHSSVLTIFRTRSVEHAAGLALRDSTRGIFDGDGPAGEAAKPSKPTPKPKPSSNARPRPAA